MKFDNPTAEEFAFIYDSWAHSFKKSPYAGCITNDMYPEVSRRTMTEIIDRGARVVVAVQELPDGGRRIMGYSVSEPEKRILHYLYVKRDYRGVGVGGALLSDVMNAGDFVSGGRYTHRTNASAKFLGRGWVHDAVPARVKG